MTNFCTKSKVKSAVGVVQSSRKFETLWIRNTLYGGSGWTGHVAVLHSVACKFLIDKRHIYSILIREWRSRENELV